MQGRDRPYGDQRRGKNCLLPYGNLAAIRYMIPDLSRLARWTETKTVWHPIGV